jgi:homoserine dehydrogenase
VALLGCGVVGSEVARIMTTHADDLAARIGAPVELAGVAVRRPAKVREGIDPDLVSSCGLRSDQSHSPDGSFCPWSGS